MIVTALITVFVSIILALLSPIPSLPPMPIPVIAAVDTLGNYIGSAVDFLIFFISWPLYIAFFGVITAVIFAEPIYNTIFWILTKIPGWNIRRG